MTVNSEGSLIIVQPTSFCNIDCKYCYVPGRNAKTRMSLETLESIFKGVLKSPTTRDVATFVYHAGEPLVMGKDFYRQATSILNKQSQILERPAKQAIQTNATLVDEEWVHIFSDIGMEVGVSIDGPDFIHDQYRVTRNGSSTHNKVLTGVRLLQQGGVEFTVIMVLTQFALDFPDEIYHFFIDNNIRHIGFNIDEFGANPYESSYTKNSWEETVARYKQFMRRFLHLVDTGGGKIVVREFTKHYATMVRHARKREGLVNGVATPLDILSFDINGNFSTFSPELINAKSPVFGNFLIGNILQQDVAEALESEKFKNLNDEIQRGVQACRDSCQYWSFCGGGSPADKFFEHGRFDVTETTACKIHLQNLVDVMFEHILVRPEPH
jgi:uncharacterized protein